MDAEEYASHCPVCNFTFGLLYVKIGRPFTCSQCSTVIRTKPLYNKVGFTFALTSGFFAAYGLGLGFILGAFIGYILSVLSAIPIFMLMRWLAPPKLIEEEEDRNPLSIL